MPANNPEMSANMAVCGTMAGQMHEITEINQEFLRLLLHPDVAELDTLLGLHSGILEGLRRLTPEQQATVAAVPMLLAEFGPLHGLADNDLVADREAPFVWASRLWQRELQGFADRLLTCIWHAARRETGVAALCMDINSAGRRKLAQLGFVALSRDSRYATASLHARLAQHPAFWPDLIHSARGSDPLRKIVSQLSVIQLSVAGQYAHRVQSGNPSRSLAYR